MGSGPASISFSEVARNEPALNRRQREVLGLIAAGKTNGEIAAALGMTLDGAKWNVSEILSKLGVASREEAAAYWRWRQRRLGPRVGSVLRALVGVPGLKWVTGAATVVAAGAVALAAVTSGGTPANPAAIHAFYLEAHITVADPEHLREAYLRWSYQDDSHFRTEYELVQPWLQTNTSVTVGNGADWLNYELISNAYSAAPLEPIQPWERLREFSGAPLIGPAPADTMAGVMDVFSRWGDGSVPARLVGRDRILGRDVEVIEYLQGRVWLDPVTMTILKNTSEKVAIEGKIVDRWVVEVTRLDDDPKLPRGTFAFSAPAGSAPMQVLEGRPTLPYPDAPCTPAAGVSSRDIPNGIRFFCFTRAVGGGRGDLRQPSDSGMLRSTYMPGGYSPLVGGLSSVAASNVAKWKDTISYAPGAMEKIQATPGAPALGGDYLRLEQVRGIADVPTVLRTAATSQVRGQTAYLTQDAGLVAIAWAEGDLVVRLSSNAVGLDELLKVAAGLEAIP
jgi:DNA-binding CsgD family transcriptional regulator